MVTRGQKTAQEEPVLEVLGFGLGSRHSYTLPSQAIGLVFG